MLGRLFPILLGALLLLGCMYIEPVKGIPRDYTGFDDPSVDTSDEVDTDTDSDTDVDTDIDTDIDTDVDTGTR